MSRKTAEKKSDVSDLTVRSAKAERLEYIHQMLLELRTLAAGVDDPMLVYLLELSMQEAAEAQKVHAFRTDH